MHHTDTIAVVSAATIKQADPFHVQSSTFQTERDENHTHAQISPHLARAGQALADVEGRDRLCAEAQFGVGALRTQVQAQPQLQLRAVLLPQPCVKESCEGMESDGGFQAIAFYNRHG
jgi:hypothetical protein